MLKPHLKLYLSREKTKFKFFTPIYHKSSAQPVRLFIYIYVCVYFHVLLCIQSSVHPKIFSKPKLGLHFWLLRSYWFERWKKLTMNQSAANKSLCWCVLIYQIVQASRWAKSLLNGTVQKKDKLVCKKGKEHKISGDRIVSKCNEWKIK